MDLARLSAPSLAATPPRPHPACALAEFVQIDPKAAQTFMNYAILTGFHMKRVGWLYGRWVTDAATGDVGVQVHAIYEPPQDNTNEDIRLTADPEAEEKIAKLSNGLHLTRVGMSACPHASSLPAHPIHAALFGGSLRGADGSRAPQSSPTRRGSMSSV